MSHLKHFEVPELLPFLAMMFREGEVVSSFKQLDENQDRQQRGESWRALSLGATPGTQIAQFPFTFDALWGEYHTFKYGLSGIPTFEDEVQIATVKMNAMRNLIAARTRRAAGNMLFLGRSELTERVAQQPMLKDVKIIFLDEIHPREARVTLFTPCGPTFKACDGGIQICGDKIMLHPAYESYFIKTLL